MTVLPLIEPSAGNASSKIEQLKQCFAETAEEFNTSPAMMRLATGKFTIEHYKEYLRQVYFYTRESPQLLSLVSAYLRGRDRRFVKTFLKHAMEEWGHDQWALRDLANLGVDVSNVPYENPLPATFALNAFTFYQIEHGNPIAHLGYVYFLEFLPTSSGAQYAQILQSMGVPEKAMSFLKEHITVDAHHNQLMELYAEELIVTEADMEAVKYSMRVTGKLYADMLIAAIEQADNPKDWGASYDELKKKRSNEKFSFNDDYAEE